jgi:hypothetical protein
MPAIRNMVISPTLMTSSTAKKRHRSGRKSD